MPLTVYRAAWVVPVAQPPLRHGWVAVEDRRIAAVGAGPGAPVGSVEDLGRVVLLPGLVNAHTHLELSWLRGRVPPALEFVDWIKRLFVTRGGRSERIDDAKVVEAARFAAREARATGTIGMGDISNSLASVVPIRDAGLRGLVFHELLGFNLPTGRSVIDTRPMREDAAARGGDAVRISVAPHAPYSVSPELFRAIRAEVDASPVPITSVHVAESQSEVQFLRDGTGPWPDILRWVGSTRDDWAPPRLGPVEYLDALGMIDARTLVVHGVQLGEASLARLAEIGCTLVTCPRSNQWVGVGVPPVERFYASGVRVAVGTDSLASVDDLNLFEELKTLRWLGPHVPARRLLESATRAGAEALGLDDEIGTIEPGKRAELLAVVFPEDSAIERAEGRGENTAERVEEYLVSGVMPRDVGWVAG